MDCPKNGGSAYNNYKHFNCLVLMAVCDAKHCFALVGIDGFGRNNDAGILLDSAFGQALENNFDRFSILHPSVINNKLLPYVFVGNYLLPLRKILDEAISWTVPI